MSRPPGFRKRVIFNSALVVALLAALNLLASVILDGRRIYRSVFPPSDDRAELPNYADKEQARRILGEFNQLATRYVPFVEWRRDEYHSTTTNVSTDGHRVQPALPQTPVGTVLFFGGSAMWGTGVADDQTIPAFFHQLEPSFRVINYGESGFSTRQDLAQLVNLVNQKQPMDLVVFYDGNNDAVTYCRPEVEINGHVHARKIQRLLKPVSWIWDDLTGSLRELLSGKAITRLFHGSAPSATRCQESDEYAQRVAETIVINWKIARAVAREGGADFVAILQPVASLGSPRVDHLNPRDYSPQNPQNTIYPIVRRLLSESGADWAYDFTDIFDGNEYTYIDVCHVTANGNRRVAERIAQIVGPRLRQITAARSNP